MQKLFGLVLLMSGLAMAVIWMPGRSGESRLARVTEITDNGIARVGRPNLGIADPALPGVAARDPAAAPASPLAIAERAAPRAAVETAARSGQARSSVHDVSAAVRPDAPSNSSGRLLTSGAELSPGAVPQPRLASARPTTEEAHYALVRDLQRELRRVGCYGGEIDGDWGPGSKRAMSVLMDRINASLPVEEPDYILLTLVRGQPDQGCREPCPSGQAATNQGRCVPSAALAHTPGDQQESRWATALPGEPTSALDTPLPGQMAVGGPRPGGDAGYVGPPEPRRDVSPTFRPRRSSSSNWTQQFLEKLKDR